MSLPDRRLSARTADSPPAVVIGLDSITGLQTARILAARGVRVVGVVADRRHWGAKTRACEEVLECRLDGQELIATLTVLADRLGRAVLFPCTDGSVRALSLHRDELPGELALPLAPHGVVEQLMDKLSFSRYAETVGLPVPATDVLESQDGVRRAASTLSFPCMVKPAVKTREWLARTQAKGFLARDAAELSAVYERVRDWAPALLVQEWVSGPEDGLFSCNAYFGAGGVPLATFVARKLRQWPPGVGTSASGEECRNDEVLDTTLRLFGGLRYRGLAYLEMKRDAVSGRLVIIEPNVGRPTGRSAIAEAGGVELVLTAYRDALALPLPDRREQRYGGARWVDLRRDAQAVLVARRTGSVSVLDWLSWMRGSKAHAIWSRQDPAPFVTDLRRASITGLRALLAQRRTPQQVMTDPAPALLGWTGWSG